MLKYRVEIDDVGNIRWYKWDTNQLHREDGPAVEWVDGGKEWYLNGKSHRENGPAIKYVNGSKYWYLNGQLHREDGPAIEYADGSKYWYLNDKFHRKNGPAREYTDGSKEWYLNGEKLTEQEFLAKQDDCNNKVIEIDGKKYRLELV